MLGLNACDKPCDAEKETLVLRPIPEIANRTGQKPNLEVFRKRLTVLSEYCATASEKENGQVEVTLLPGHADKVEKLASIPGKFDAMETYTYREMEPFMAAMNTQIVEQGLEEEMPATFLTYLRTNYTIDPERPFLGEVLEQDMYRVRELLKVGETDSLLMSMGAAVMLTFPEEVEGESVSYLVAVKRQTGKEYMGQRIMESFVGGTEEKPAVRVALDAKGAQALRKLTEGNLERNIAMVLDGLVWQTPTIRTPLIEGKFELTGGLDKAESEVLAAVLNGGELKVPMERVQE